MSATVLEIIKAAITAAGGDGLVDAKGECGCNVSDLAPCGEIGHDCEIARLWRCPAGHAQGYLFYQGYDIAYELYYPSDCAPECKQCGKDMKRMGDDE